MGKSERTQPNGKTDLDLNMLNAARLWWVISQIGKPVPISGNRFLMSGLVQCAGVVVNWGF